MAQGLITSIAAVALCVLLAGCFELLPPRNDPSEFFTGTLAATYELSAFENRLYFLITFRNNYDETLQGFAGARGTITIDWLAPPEQRGIADPRRTDVLTATNISFARKFNRSTNILTIDPGDSIRLFYSWDWKTDDSTDVRRQFRFRNDLTCMKGPGTFRRISERNAFSVRCQVKLFDRSAAVYLAPVNFSLCYVDVYLTNPVCTPIPPSGACDF